MFITKKKHNKEILCFVEENKRLTKELEEAKNLKEILNQLAQKELTVTGGFGITVNGGSHIEFDDSVAVYVDDMLGGKVIKQEATKCLIISKDGKVETGYTKEKADKGYSYKLIRE